MTHTRLQVLIARIVCIILILPLTLIVAEAQAWHAELYAKNNDYIEITIKTKSIMEKVACTVSFLDKQNHEIRKESYPITDGTTSYLKPNTTYVKYVPHTVTTAVSATGDDLVFVVANKADESAPPPVGHLNASQEKLPSGNAEHINDTPGEHSKSNSMHKETENKQFHHPVIMREKKAAKKLFMKEPVVPKDSGE